MPGINDAPEQVEKIVELCEEAGATYIGGQTLFLRGSDAGRVLRAGCATQRPDLVPRYEQLYAAARYLPEAERREIERAAGAPWLRAGGYRRPRPAPLGERLRSLRGARAPRAQRSRRRRSAGRRPRCRASALSICDGGHIGRIPVKQLRTRVASVDADDVLKAERSRPCRPRRAGLTLQALRRDERGAARAAGDRAAARRPPCCRLRSAARRCSATCDTPGPRRRRDRDGHPRLGAGARRRPLPRARAVPPHGPRDGGHGQLPDPAGLHRADACSLLRVAGLDPGTLPSAARSPRSSSVSRRSRRSAT